MDFKVFKCAQHFLLHIESIKLHVNTVKSVFLCSQLLKLLKLERRPLQTSHRTDTFHANFCIDVFVKAADVQKKQERVQLSAPLQHTRLWAKVWRERPNIWSLSHLILLHSSWISFQSQKSCMRFFLSILPEYVFNICCLKIKQVDARLCECDIPPMQHPVLLSIPAHQLMWKDFFFC